MKRREFLFNSLLTLGGAALLNSVGFNSLSAEDKKNVLKVVRRKFKNTTMPLLGMGCMRLPVKNGKPDIAEFEKMADYAMAHGLNHFDTAYPYHAGESEKALRQVLKSYSRSSYTISNKLPTWMINSKDDIKRILEEQLKKCGTDYFDLYLVHSLAGGAIKNYRKQKIFEELSKFKEKNIIKNLGFSFHDNTQSLKEIVAEHKWDFCLLQINYLDWRLLKAEEHYEIATKAGIPVMVMEPLRGGALCNLTTAAAAQLKKDFPNETQASFGLKWVAEHKNVFTILSGMSNFQQVKENTDTFVNYKPIGAKGLLTANEIVKVIQSKGEINCTACKYCSDCPVGINIPAIFSAYNAYKNTGNKRAFIRTYDNLDDDEKAENCIFCGKCVKHCPQALDIPALLKKVVVELNSLR